jgi:hypothetical protein
MESLNITKEEIVSHPERVTEKLFCVAILNEGTDIAARILYKFRELKMRLNQEATDD